MESIYKSYTPDQYQELFSNFLISSWSYSKVTTFARHEKAFEMQYIYGLYSRNSATTIAGKAYHKALEYYFAQKKLGKTIDLPELEASAFALIDETPANAWKIQKTSPTVEACVQKATDTVVKLLRNFYTEKGVYEDDIEEIIDVEVYFDEFVTVNGVDIPLPCHGVIDLVVRTKEGKIAVVDHKSKQAFTDEKEVALSIGTQAITYVLAYESKTSQQVHEVWFVENKHSQNKDKGPQLNKFPVVIDDNTRRLYEALLYEPLKRMIEAVSNPDYCYLINESDNFVDMSEMYDFWARTMIAEFTVDDFNIEDAKKELVAKRIKKIRDSSASAAAIPAVIKQFKEKASQFIQYDLSTTDMTTEQKIEHVLRSFGVIVKVAHKFEGYSSNTYLLEVSAGVKVSSIFNYKLDIANQLNVPTVRISREMKVHDGKAYLAIEVEKTRSGILAFNKADRQGLKIPLGKDNFGNVIYWDLGNHSTPHAMVCGQTGSGKSVCLTNIIDFAHDVIDNIVILDPKYSNDFTRFRKQGILVQNDIEEIEATMAKLVVHMNDLIKKGREEYTLVVLDEFADAIANSRKGKALMGEKSLEENLRILVQKGRSCGMRVIAGTQRASTKVITGDAKANFSVQICFRLQKEVDSRVVLDEPGAEALTGKGDGLLKSPEYNDIVRFQAYYKEPTNVVVAHNDSEVNATIVQ